MFLETPPLDVDGRAKVWRNFMELVPAHTGDLETDDPSLPSGWRARLCCPRGGRRTSLSFVVAVATTCSWVGWRGPVALGVVGASPSPLWSRAHLLCPQGGRRGSVALGLTGAALSPSG